MKHSTKVTVRTILQAAAGFAVVAPALVEEVGVDKSIPWVAGGLVAAGVVARVMATPTAQRLLGKLNTSIEQDEQKK